MKRAIFYLTFNGVFNNTNGVGTQTKTLLQGINYNYEKLKEQYGDFVLNLVVPIFNEKTWGYNESHVKYAEEIVTQTGGSIFYVPYCVDTFDFWTVNNWRAMSYAAATIVLQQARHYTESLVMTIDPPYLEAPLLIEQSKKDFDVSVKSLMTMFSSTYILEQKSPNVQKISWEKFGLGTANISNDIRISNICESFTSHLRSHYELSQEVFIDYPSSLFLESPDFVPYSQEEVAQILSKYGIPRNKKIILAFGRADYVKGFDIFLNNLDKVKESAHIVLVASPFSPQDPLLEEYKRLIAQNNITSITFVDRYSRELPKALSQWENTLVAVCPSRGDTFPNVPLEVALWANKTGPICVTSNADGLEEQIINGYNGFKFDINNPSELSELLERAFNLSESERNVMRENAYEKVIKERDFYKNFVTMLNHFWK